MRFGLPAVLISIALIASACVGEVAEGSGGGDDVGGPDASPNGPDASPEVDPPDAGPVPTVWKAVLMTGDDSISAFDNARKTVKDLIEEEGVANDNTIQLSRKFSEQVDGVRATSVDNFEEAMLDLEADEGDACFVFMTSHGTQSGFYIRSDNYLTPNKLNQVLDDACGDLPTVALISACFSGVFVEPVSAPNRVILTAARSDRTSFGCSSEATYTYWDGCLITNWGSADTWQGLYDNIVDCIEGKESQGGFTPSHPQGFFGADMQDAPMFHR